LAVPISACRLQDCLSANTYSPQKCEERMRQLYLCCQSMYETTDGRGESTACPMPSAVHRWLNLHPTSK
ncbi:hypothetical protein PENSPDRAFT_592071, partial [Peniophora sp. CONT]